MVLHLGEEEPDPFGGEILDAQPVHGFARAFGQKRHQQAKRVAIAPLGVAREIALGDQMLNEEAAHPRSDRGFSQVHGLFPVDFWRCVGEESPAVFLSECTRQRQIVLRLADAAVPEISGQVRQ